MRPQLVSLGSLFSAAALALTAFAASACNGAVAACDKKCDCEQCTTSQHNICLATGESDEQTALQTACTSELDDLHACQAAGVCKGKDFQTECSKQTDAWKKCSDAKK